jgi:hypothetical protein
LNAIEYWLREIDPWWTYLDNGWTRSILPFGGKGYKRSVLEPEAEQLYSLAWCQHRMSASMNC